MCSWAETEAFIQGEEGQVNTSSSTFPVVLDFQSSKSGEVCCNVLEGTGRALLCGLGSLCGLKHQRLLGCVQGAVGRTRFRALFMMHLARHLSRSYVSLLEN